MRTPDDTALTPEERAVIERFRCHYAPPPPTASQRAAMRNALHARLHRQWLPSWPSLAAAACVAALTLWFVLPERRSSPPETASVASGNVLAAYALEGDANGDVDDLLPQDYATIEYIFDL
jgi:hypothetical protein